MTPNPPPDVKFGREYIVHVQPGDEGVQLRTTEKYVQYTTRVRTLDESGRPEWRLKSPDKGKNDVHVPD